MIPATNEGETRDIFYVQPLASNWRGLMPEVDAPVDYASRRIVEKFGSLGLVVPVWVWYHQEQRH